MRRVVRINYCVEIAFNKLNKSQFCNNDAAVSLPGTFPIVRRFAYCSASASTGALFHFAPSYIKSLDLSVSDRVITQFNMQSQAALS